MVDSEARMGNQTVLYEYFCNKLSSGGLTREELDPIKEFPIGHNSVEGFVRLNIALGNFDWRGDTLVNANRTLALKLTSVEEDKLKRRAKGLGLTPKKFLTQIVIEKLSQK